MAEKDVVYDNLWTKLGLGRLRSNRWFKGIWRGVRVAVVAALLGIADSMLGIMSATGLPETMVVAFAPIIEKWLREFVEGLKF